MWAFLASRSGCKSSCSVNLVPPLIKTITDALTGAATGKIAGASDYGRPAMTGIIVRVPCFRLVPRWRGLRKMHAGSGEDRSRSEPLSLYKPGLLKRLLYHCQETVLQLEVELSGGTLRKRFSLNPPDNRIGSGGGSTANGTQKK